VPVLPSSGKTSEQDEHKGAMMTEQRVTVEITDGVAVE